MTRKITLLLSICISFVLLTGFGDSHKRFMIDNPGPSVFETMTANATTEVKLTEDLAIKRDAYQKQLEKLQAFYHQTGNVMKFEWAEKELTALMEAPKYRYIIQAEIAGTALVASNNIPDADNMYYQALEQYKKATRFFTNKEELRLALTKFNTVIKNFPTSDKIDDSAFIAGRIHERFKDYAIAVLYYKRAFQWNNLTPYPARYRTAKLLDYKMSEHAEALSLYREAMQYETEYLNEDQQDAIQARMDELTGPLSMTGVE